jgi:lysine-specific demethylase 8
MYLREVENSVGAGVPGPVRRVHARDVPTVRSEIARGEPVLLEHMIDSWSALTTWTPLTLRDRLRDVTMKVETWDAPTNDPATYVNREARSEAMSLARYVDEIVLRPEPSKARYAAQLPLAQIAPALKGDIGSLTRYMSLPAWMPPPVTRRLVRQAYLWLGPAGTISTAHFDLAQNFFVQITGKKKFLLFSPDQKSELHYPEPTFGYGRQHFSPVDVEHPDLARHPRFASARGHEVVVAPGEVLHIPAGWWHYVRSLEPSISLNFWWQNPRAASVSVPHVARELVGALRKRVRS